MAPSNFCPIALTLVVAKVFHEILADRLELFLIYDSIIEKYIYRYLLICVCICVSAIHSFIFEAI